MEHNILQEFGRRIRYMREITNTTQEDLRKAIGFKSTGAISQVENGTKGMKFESVIKSAQFFGVHPVVLITTGNLSKTDLSMVMKMMEVLREKNKSESYNEIVKILN